MAQTHIAWWLSKDLKKLRFLHSSGSQGPAQIIYSSMKQITKKIVIFTCIVCWTSIHSGLDWHPQNGELLHLIMHEHKGALDLGIADLQRCLDLGIAQQLLIYLNALSEIWWQATGLTFRTRAVIDASQFQSSLLGMFWCRLNWSSAPSHFLQTQFAREIDVMVSLPDEVGHLVMRWCLLLHSPLHLIKQKAIHSHEWQIFSELCWCSLSACSRASTWPSAQSIITKRQNWQKIISVMCLSSV